jgi:hypothetical protein
MDGDFISIAKEYIENFDSKDIPIVILFFIGRSGSSLLHSLLDSNENILLLPVAFAFYHDWEVFYGEYKEYNPSKEKIKEIVYSLIYKSSFLFGINYNKQLILGSNRSERLELDLEELFDIVVEIIFEFKFIDRKTYFLALHLAYAKIKKFDLKKIECIFFHHHFRIEEKLFSKNDLISSKESYINLLNKINTDFNKIKIISTIRYFFDAYNSNIEYIKIKNILLISDYFAAINTLIQTALFGVYEFYNFKNNNSFIKFEEMHKKTEVVMKKLALFLKINYSTQMLNSTIDGKTYWGDNPQKLVNGVNKNFCSKKNIEKISLKEKNLIKYLFDYFFDFYKYEKLTLKESTNIYEMSDIEFNSYLYGILNNISFQINKEDFYENYPKYRNNLINYFSKENIEIIVNSNFSTIPENIVGENIVFYKNTKINFIKTITKDVDLFSKSTYLIYICLEQKISEEIIEFVDSFVDQVWVIFPSIKNKLVNNILEKDKVKLVKPLINISKNDFNLFKQQVNSIEKKKDTFNFLYISNSTEEKDINIMIKIFNELFYDNSNIYLDIIILDEENLAFRLSEINKDNDRINFVKSRLLKDKENIFLNAKAIIFNYISLLNISFIIEALFFDLDIIVPNSNFIKELIPEKILNFVATDSSEFNLNEKELKQQMLALVKKTTSTPKNLPEEYLLDNSLEIIYSYLEELDNKTIFRESIKEVKKNLLNSFEKYIQENNLEEAETIILRLLAYEKNNTDFLYKYALVQYKKNNLETTIETLSKILKLGVKNKEIISLLSKCLKTK